MSSKTNTQPFFQTRNTLMAKFQSKEDPALGPIDEEWNQKSIRSSIRADFESSGRKLVEPEGSSYDLNNQPSEDLDMEASYVSLFSAGHRHGGSYEQSLGKVPCLSNVICRDENTAQDVREVQARLQPWSGTSWEANYPI